MHLTKHHGLGNDFLVALVDDVPVNGAALARAWCDRRTGIGADGLIFGSPAVDADLAMTLFNADGSEAEISGNGLRCLAQAVASARHCDGLELVIVSGGGRRQLEVRPTGRRGLMQVAVDMGPVDEGPQLPSAAELSRPGFRIGRAGTADVGNPHVILEVEGGGEPDPGFDGPAIEALWKPTGINVHFMRHTGDDEITLTHWERGAGVTLACGTGATASATVAHRWGLVGPDVTVCMPGGRAEVLIGDGAATLIGPAVLIAHIEADETDIVSQPPLSGGGDGHG